MKEVTEDQVALFLYLATSQLQKEYLDEIKVANFYVRTLKKEANRRVRFDKKYIDKEIVNMFKVSDDDIINVMGGLEVSFNEIVEESIKKIKNIVDNKE
jgi:hypothetical protein